MKEIGELVRILLTMFKESCKTKIKQDNFAGVYPPKREREIKSYKTRTCTSQSAIDPNAVHG